MKDIRTDGRVHNLLPYEQADIDKQYKSECDSAAAAQQSKNVSSDGVGCLGMIVFGAATLSMAAKCFGFF